MTNRESLLASIDTFAYLTLSALADDAEESGDSVRAMGYRWLAEKRKWPILHADGDYYAWYRPPVGDEHHDEGDGCVLPLAVCKTLPWWGKKFEDYDRSTLTPSAAIVAGALAIGQWLACLAQEQRRLAIPGHAMRRDDAGAIVGDAR